MTSAEARELFSAAADAQLDDTQQRGFDAAIDADAALASEYAAFCATLDAVSEVQASAPPPDLLRGVQRRLRSASGGRFYGDRFSERAGVGRFSPWVLLCVCVVVLVLAFGAMQLFGELGARVAP